MSEYTLLSAEMRQYLDVMVCREHYDEKKVNETSQMLQTIYDLSKSVDNELKKMETEIEKKRVESLLLRKALQEYRYILKDF
jgi:hypothetical protein